MDTEEISNRSYIINKVYIRNKRRVSKTLGKKLCGRSGLDLFKPE